MVCVCVCVRAGDADGNLIAVETKRVEWIKNAQGAFIPQEVEGSEQRFECDLCFLAMVLKFTCCTRTNVHKKTDAEGAAAGAGQRGRICFTCFTGTKVQSTDAARRVPGVPRAGADDH